MNANFYALLRGHFHERISEPCLLIPDGPVIHYDQLDAASARIAHALIHAGCTPGDRVAAQVDKCWEALALYLACLRAGLVYLPLNTGYQKRNLGSNALALVEHWGFTRGDVLLHALPIYHIHGLFVAIHCVLLSGSRMLWLAKFDPEEVRSLLPRATVMMGVPTFYTRLLANPAFSAADCQSMRLFI